MKAWEDGGGEGRFAAHSVLTRRDCPRLRVPGILTVYVIIALVTVAVEVAAGGVVFAFLSDLNDAKTSTSSSFQRRINGVAALHVPSTIV